MKNNFKRKFFWLCKILRTQSSNFEICRRKLEELLIVTLLWDVPWKLYEQLMWPIGSHLSRTPIFQKFWMVCWRWGKWANSHPEHYKALKKFNISNI